MIRVREKRTDRSFRIQTHPAMDYANGQVSQICLKYTFHVGLDL